MLEVKPMKLCAVRRLRQGGCREWHGNAGPYCYYHSKLYHGLLTPFPDTVVLQSYLRSTHPHFAPRMSVQLQEAA